MSFGFSASAFVDIGDIGVGARPLGLGKACVAGMDDSTAIFTNPAGLGLKSNFDLVSMSGTLLSEINYLVIGVSNNYPVGSVGIGYIKASVGDIPITYITGSGSTQAVVQSSSADYGSSVLFISYASELTRFLLGRGEGLFVGTNIKYFSQGFTGGGATVEATKGTGLDADLGFVWQARPNLNLGLTINNFLPASVGGKFQWDNSSSADSIPMATKVGSNLLVMGEDGVFDSEKHKLIWLLEYELEKNEVNRPALWHTGVEFWPLDILALRLGIDQKPKATTTGTSFDSNFTAGVGIKYVNFSFDYAYHQFGDVAENATHFFSFGYSGPEESKLKRWLSGDNSVPLAKVVAKPALTTFVDVLEGHWARRPIEYLATLNIMSGYPDKTFRPDDPITRGELAALLVKSKGFDLRKPEDKPFIDIAIDHWVAPYVQVAADRKYITGYPDGTFLPSKTITRAEAASVFARFAGLSIKSNIATKPFPDVFQAHWAAPAVSAGKEVGFFEYLAGKPFKPNMDLTRAEAAEILSKTPFVKEKIKKLISKGR